MKLTVGVSYDTFSRISGTKLLAFACFLDLKRIFLVAIKVSFLEV